MRLKFYSQKIVTKYFVHRRPTFLSITIECCVNKPKKSYEQRYSSKQSSQMLKVTRLPSPFWWWERFKSNKGLCTRSERKVDRLTAPGATDGFHAVGFYLETSQSSRSISNNIAKINLNEWIWQRERRSFQYIRIDSICLFSLEYQWTGVGALSLPIMFIFLVRWKKFKAIEHCWIAYIYGLLCSSVMLRAFWRHRGGT